jgi:solute:Na+ symporter, SSS family
MLKIKDLNMNITLFVCMLFCLQFFYLFVGRRGSRNVKSKEEYFLAGKNIRFFPLMMTFLATQVGGGVILGAAEEAYRFGWPVLFYPLGTALGLIVLGCGIGRRLAKFQVSTVAQIFEVVYGSVRLKRIASILSIVSLFMILVAQIIASHKFLISLGLDNRLFFILFWAIVIIYTTQGGLRAVISTDKVQAALFSGIFLVAFGWVWFFEPSGSLIQLPSVENMKNVSSKLWGWLLMPLLFMVIEQDMGQRCFAGASPKIVSKASFVAGICTMIVCVVPVFFGSLARQMKMEIPEGGSVLMGAVSQLTNPWLAASVGCAVLAAIISTATSLINAISSNLSSDFNLSYFRKIEPMRMVKGMTCLISVGSIFFAFYFDNIVDLLIQSYELSVSCLFVPIGMALFRKKGNFISAFSSIVLGGAGFILFRIYPISFPKEIVTILLASLGYSAGELLIAYRRRERKA